MISIEEYRKIVSELMDELPSEFFQQLSGGVIVSDATVIQDYARDNNLFTLGQYQVFSGMRRLTWLTLRQMKLKHGTGCVVYFATSSDTIWSPWVESIILPRLKQRIN